MTVESPTGIGSARIVRAGTSWPETIILGLCYADGRPFSRLESLRIETGECSWSTFLGNADTVACTGGSDASAEGSLIYVPVRRGEQALSVEIPAQSLGSTCDTLRVSWIDVYRH
ncbi:hypothetical protein JXA88_04120 [Candidatus Fermentibacteria bacterium]|nr:hypothetical protein [Candidatus Fermentibacteria bacterium]